MMNDIAANESHLIRYQFIREDGTTLRYKVELHPDTLTQVNVERKPEHDNWTRLEHKRCSNCKLDPQEHSHCPAAVALSMIIDDWGDTKPHEELHLHCRNGRRKISAHASVQDGLGSLMGLLLATSDCPHFDFFKPMARFHLPVSSPEEAYFRVLGTYFIHQYFSGNKRCESALQDVSEIYSNIEVVNKALAERIANLETQYATASALVVLDLLAQLFSVSPEDSIADIERLFRRN